jgi:RNA polymerase sigma-70 factor (ECF subfamily)
VAVDVEEHYRRYGPMVLRRCRRLLRNEEKALDAMHDVFVRLLASESKLDASAPSALLFRIATNVCLNQLRTERRHPEDREDALLLTIAASEDTEQRSIARTLLSRALGREVESTQTIAVLHLLDRMTLEEVAAEVGMSVSGVRKRLRGLRARVKELEDVG